MTDTAAPATAFGPANVRESVERIDAEDLPDTDDARITLIVPRLAKTYLARRMQSEVYDWKTKIAFYQGVIQEAQNIDHNGYKKVGLFLAGAVVGALVATIWWGIHFVDIISGITAAIAEQIQTEAAHAATNATTNTTGAPP